MAREADLLTAIQQMNTLLALVAVKGISENDAVHLLSRAGYTQTEIGNLLGVTANAVQKRLNRSQKKRGKKPE